MKQQRQTLRTFGYIRNDITRVGSGSLMSDLWGGVDSTYEASSTVSERMIPFGADTATSSPTALSGRGRGAAEANPERSATALMRGAK